MNLCLPPPQVDLDAEDEAALRAMLQQQRTQVRRLDDAVLAGGSSSGNSKPAADGAASQPGTAKPVEAVNAKPGFGVRPLAVVVKKRKAPEAGKGAAAKKVEPLVVAAAGSDGESGGGGLLGLGDYGSSSGSDKSPGGSS